MLRRNHNSRDEEEETRMDDKPASAAPATRQGERPPLLLGRAWLPALDGPSVVTVRDGEVIDITSRQGPTVRDVCEMPDPAGYVAAAPGKPVGPLQEVLKDSAIGTASTNPVDAAGQRQRPWLLAPIDLQAIKASGVTFVVSLLERVIEEQAKGSPEKAAAIRKDIDQLIGEDLSKLVPGSPQALQVKQALIAKGVWSQYLEVGIGPDPEIFTKAQPMSAVGPGADIGILSTSTWNNPEPEIAVVVSSHGRVIGATLGNDVNLRDIEGRSALLLGKAKDNNASCALGPFIRLFDDGFTLADVAQAEIRLTVEGPEGYRLEGASSMNRISRQPEDLVAAAAGVHHQYPDGFVLFLGTMFAPIQDRDTPGQGFTHRIGDVVAIETPALGRLVNQVRYCEDCPPWNYGASHLMRSLAARKLL
jgi:fumarylacetoacetate (FAA) hydrolase family protein